MYTFLEGMREGGLPEIAWGELVWACRGTAPLHLRTHHVTDLMVPCAREVGVGQVSNPLGLSGAVGVVCEGMVRSLETADPVYYRDVFGQNGEGKTGFFLGLVATYLTFLILEDSRPVTISGNLGSVCHSCREGKHCRGGFRHSGGVSVSPADENFETMFLEERMRARSRVVGGQVIEIVTSAGVVREYLRRQVL